MNLEGEKDEKFIGYLHSFSDYVFCCCLRWPNAGTSSILAHGGLANFHT